jgi:hypothetical protein
VTIVVLDEFSNGFHDVRIAPKLHAKSARCRACELREQHLEERFAIFVLELANSWIKYAGRVPSPDCHVSPKVHASSLEDIP